MKTTISITMLSILLVGFSCLSLNPDTTRDSPPFVANPDLTKLLDKVDIWLDQIPLITKTGESIIESPVGELFIPESVKKGLRLGGEFTLALVATFLAWRKKIFKNGFRELAYSNQIFVTETEQGNKELESATHKGLNPPTVKLLQKEKYINGNGSFNHTDL